MNNLISKADTLLEALPYMQRFRSETFVTVSYTHLTLPTKA